MKRSSEFSYRCEQCNQCCKHYKIQVNPYEILHIAAALDTTTTRVLDQYVEPELPYLKRHSDGSCVFLTDSGCSIHSHRPGVCRVYPLGRNTGNKKVSHSEEHFTRLPPLANSSGIFDTDGTVDEYLQLQGVDPYFEAGDRCLTMQQAMLSQISNDLDFPEGFNDHPLQWLDADLVLTLSGKSNKAKSVEDKFSLYLEQLACWLNSSVEPETSNKLNERR